ncbi:MAG: zinc ribbon domain-containing protein [Lachnospiraceae bacterium]|nr:zinc ribbon domain-containing protein [Lachnospiraceae bacterium]
MKELKQTLKNLVDGQAYLKSLLPAAPVLVLIDPLLLLVYNISSFRFYYLSSGLFFVIYLVGLVLCLAAENDWAVGLAFAIKALAYLINFAGYATFSKLVYVALYGVAAFYFLREFFTSEEGKKLAADFAAKSNPSMTKTTTITCPGCGLQIQALSGGGFCPQCGGPLPVVEQPQPQPQPVEATCAQCGQKLPSGTKFCPTCGAPAPEEVANAPVGSAPGSLTAFCSGGIFLIFTIVMTAKLVCATVLQFNLLNLIGSIPAIIVCLGLWFS